MEGLDTLKELQTTIHQTDHSDVIDNLNILDEWMVILAEAISELEDVAGELEKKDEQITDLQNQVDELEEAEMMSDDIEDAIEVESLEDQMKIEYLREVFRHYTLADFESLIPKR